MTPDNRPRLRLLSFERIDKGALVGKAKVRLPNQLEIDGIGVFQKDSRRWSQMPSEVTRGRDGNSLKDEHGSPPYRPPLKWANRDLQDGFSAALIELIEAEYGLLDGGAP
jgi:hypothetical protein